MEAIIWSIFVLYDKRRDLIELSQFISGLVGLAVTTIYLMASTAASATYYSP